MKYQPEDIVGIAGCAMIALGAGMVYRPAALIVGGLLALLLAIGAAMHPSRRRRP